ncbi:hypothetical protein QBC47DRAFT_405814 [Echria macrotheca]|uniref:Uncharacterized protein n=1 Tax=Echria macrotheca TaxID=438768 RepID=A0AAJ0B5X4_9PEZI|nr:hypothetical protein QBC47DRAFT_405814 [Echria macrotheca]
MRSRPSDLSIESLSGTPTSQQAYTTIPGQTSEYRAVSPASPRDGAYSPQERLSPIVNNAGVDHIGPNLTHQTTLSPTEHKLGNVSTSAWSFKTGSDQTTNLPAQDRRPIWRQWLVEILFFVVSLCSFIIIIAVLGAYNGRSLPKLPMNITLNTFLAFFTTFTKAAFMTPISEALSQWKWNLLTPGGPKRRQGTLSDFELLDSASRGTWGSCRLLGVFKWRHFVSMTAFLSIVSIFTSPVMQNMIAYPERPAPVKAEAHVPLTASYTENNPTALGDIMRATFLGTSNTVANPVMPVEATCGTSNCTFTPYTSLAVCMKIKDVSDRLTVAEIKNSTSADWTNGEASMSAVGDGNGTTAWNATLPNGISFVTPLSYAMLLIGNDVSLAFADDPVDRLTALAHMFAIYPNAGNVSYPGFDRASNPEPWAFRAVEVLYHACVNTYETTVVAGNSTTVVTASSSALLDVDGNDQSLYNAQCNFTARDLSATSCGYLDKLGGVVYLADPEAPASQQPKYGFSRLSSNMFTYNTYFDMSSSFVADGIENNMAYYTKQNYFPLKLAVYGLTYHLKDPSEQLQRLGVYFDGMAVAMSNALRTGSLSNAQHEGVALANETYVSIRWGWAAFLAVQILLAYFFLAWTIYRTAKLRTPVFKSSELATLLASTDELRVAIGSVDGVGVGEKGLQERAKKVPVKFEGGRLVLA